MKIITIFAQFAVLIILLIASVNGNIEYRVPANGEPIFRAENVEIPY